MIRKSIATLFITMGLQTAALAGGHAELAVMGEDQDVSGGTVTAAKVIAGANGWLVVHRTDDKMKPGPVVGHAPLKKGENKSLLTDPEVTNIDCKAHNVNL